ncbi:MAG: DUF4145 domain-containing protein [Candidatus Pacearchaeota archaeon]|nr:DUF4145 domain-containing protein [Candidatus Pacearchaeota archaeon]
MTSIVIKGYDLNGTQNSNIDLSTDESISCPFCHKAIQTQPLTLFYDGSLAQIFLKCKDCKNSFIGYTTKDTRGIYHIHKLSKGNHKTRNFSNEIKDLSEGFIRIYGESEFAEQENLMEICGVGYRKALEYLIKDYLIKKTPDDEDSIKSTFLGTCISTKIQNEKIKEIARRATWLGNDETHYVRKWEDKDISDLKKLIDITVHFISMEIEADNYIERMEE